MHLLLLLLRGMLMLHVRRRLAAVRRRLLQLIRPGWTEPCLLLLHDGRLEHGLWRSAVSGVRGRLGRPIAAVRTADNGRAEHHRRGHVHHGLRDGGARHRRMRLLLLLLLMMLLLELLLRRRLLVL